MFEDESGREEGWVMNLRFTRLLGAGQSLAYSTLLWGSPKRSFELCLLRDNVSCL